MKKLLLLFILICLLLCFSNTASAKSIAEMYKQGRVIWIEDGYIYAIGTASIKYDNYEQIAELEAGMKVANKFRNQDREFNNIIIALSDRFLLIERGICYVLIRFPLEILGKTDFAQSDSNKPGLQSPAFLI